MACPPSGPPRVVRVWLMLGFFAAFATKLPSVPVHTWLPDAHTQASTASSVILAGILLKADAYGLVRFAVPLFPEESRDFAWWAMLLGAASILYGGAMALQPVGLQAPGGLQLDCPHGLRAARRLTAGRRRGVRPVSDAAFLPGRTEPAGDRHAGLRLAGDERDDADMASLVWVGVFPAAGARPLGGDHPRLGRTAATPRRGWWHGGCCAWLYPAPLVDLLRDLSL